MIKTRTGAGICDATQIYQVLMGLFTNAGYAMKDNGGVLEVILDRVKIDDGQTDFGGRYLPGNLLNCLSLIPDAVFIKNTLTGF